MCARRREALFRRIHDDDVWVAIVSIEPLLPEWWRRAACTSRFFPMTDRYDPERLTSETRVLWERLVGEMPSIVTRLYMFSYRFLPADGSPATSEFPRHLRMKLYSWRYWLLRAYEERQALREASAEYIPLIIGPERNDRALFAKDSPERIKSAYLLHRTVSATYSFYFALKALLDRIGTTVPWYFGVSLKGVRGGSRHRMLDETFPRLHQRIAGSEKPPGDLRNAMHGLSKRIVDLRNQQIEHPTDPSDGFTAYLDPRPEHVKRYVPIFATRIDDLPSKWERLEDPDTLLADVEQYVALMLDYMQEHEGQSILRRDGD